MKFNYELFKNKYLAYANIPLNYGIISRIAEKVVEFTEEEKNSFRKEANEILKIKNISKKRKMLEEHNLKITKLRFKKFDEIIENKEKEKEIIDFIVDWGKEYITCSDCIIK